MKTVFFIGNGFDINLGMKTRYSDFYSYYNERKSESILVKALKENMDSDYVNWSDLELALGQYTDKITSLEEFDEIYEDICNELADYLDAEESKFDFNNINEKKFYNYLCFPEKYLSVGDYNSITDFRSNWRGYPWTIDIITFNYTRTLEKILNVSNLKQPVNVGEHNRIAITLNSLEHIHGFCDDRMVLGVNDISQIKNNSFHDNIEVLEGLIKSVCNSTHNHTIDKQCVKKIETADLICIFGSSIGETDNFWWELICERLKKDCRLMVFFKGSEILLRFSHKKGRILREVKSRLLAKIDLSPEEKNLISQKIYISVNSDLFSGLIDAKHLTPHN